MYLEILCHVTCGQVTILLMILGDLWHDIKDYSPWKILYTWIRYWHLHMKLMSKKTLHSVAVPATCVYVKVISLIRNADNHFEHGANALDMWHSLCFNLIDPEKLDSKVVKLSRSIFFKDKMYFRIFQEVFGKMVWFDTVFYTFSNHSGNLAMWD